MVKRSKLEICFEVLKAIKKGIARPTLIMYQTNLSWHTLQDVFEILILSGFIKRERMRNRMTYKMTSKGRHVLSYYLKASEGFSKIEEMSNA